jgi:predicted DCC family thiol-disulfide oxidoreductase YuxK
MFTRSRVVSQREVQCKSHGLVVWRDGSCPLCRNARYERHERLKRRRVVTTTLFALAAGLCALWLREKLPTANVSTSSEVQHAAQLGLH